MKRTSKDKARVGAGGRLPHARTRRLPWMWVFLGGGGILVVGVVLLSLFAPHLLGLGIKDQAFLKAPEVVLATAQSDYRLSEQRGKVVVLFLSFPG